MRYLKVRKVLDIIDKQFGYDFEGKEEDDHLIGKKTWNSYVRAYLLEKVNDLEYMRSYEDKIIGDNRHTEYQEDFVNEVIKFRKTQLIKQFNSNRKTTIDHEAIKAFETIASALDVKYDADVKKRIPITQYKQKQEGRFPIATKEDIEHVRTDLLEIVVNQLIDMEKLNHDVYQHLISGFLDYGFAAPLEMNEDIEAHPLGFRIDAKNYLKESVRNELVKMYEQ